MTSTSFRDSTNSLGWSRRDPDLPVRTSNSSSTTPFLSRLQSFNPFGGSEGYVQLPTQEVPAETRRDEQDEEGWFACESRDFPYLFYDNCFGFHGPSNPRQLVPASVWTLCTHISAVELFATCFTACTLPYIISFIARSLVLTVDFSVYSNKMGSDAHLCRM